MFGGVLRQTFSSLETLGGSAGQVSTLGPSGNAKGPAGWAAFTRGYGVPPAGGTQSRAREMRHGELLYTGVTRNSYREGSN